MSPLQKPLFLFSSLLLVSGLGASSLEIYSDGAFYHYKSDDKFIGFNSELKGECGTKSLKIEPKTTCPPSLRLCTLYENLIAQTRGYSEVKTQYETLTTLLGATKPEVPDAPAWIEAAMNIGKQKSKLEIDMTLLKEQLDNDTQGFERQTSDQRPHHLEEGCKEELHLQIPSGMIGASLSYEANIVDEKNIAITQLMKLSNQSGIDIVADDVAIYAKSSYLSLAPLTFNPWVASIAVPYHEKKSRVYETEEAMPVMMAAPVAEAAPPSPPMVVKTGYRNYTIKSLSLPSTGNEIESIVAEEKLPMECELVAHPYKDTNLYHACSFQPKEALETNTWRLTKDKRLITTDARGEYRDGKYLLFTDIDDSILITHKKSITNDSSSGIFGGSIRKKDGYELDIINTLATPKDIKIIERIPYSTTDEIKVKLTSVQGANTHTLGQNGELEIKIKLQPNESRKIKIDFELEYDKEVSVNY